MTLYDLEILQSLSQSDSVWSVDLSLLAFNYLENDVTEWVSDKASNRKAMLLKYLKNWNG